VIRFGTTEGATLTIIQDKNNLRVVGPAQHFHGYKYSDATDDGAYITWSANQQEVIIESDPLGLLPYFIYHHKNLTIVSNNLLEMLHLCSSNVSVDWTAMAIFIRLGHHIGDDTLFGEIKRLPQNSLVTITPNGLSITPKPSVPFTGTSIKLSDAVEGYVEIFDKIITDAVQSRDFELIQPLSGGRDSRHILAALLKAGHPPNLCITQALPAPQRNDDVTISESICRNLNLRHVVCPPVTNHYKAETYKNSRISYESMYHAWFCPISVFLETLPTSVILDGLGGDVLSESKTIKPEYYHLIQNEPVEVLANKILGDDTFLKTQINKTFARMLAREPATQRLSDELRKHLGEPNPLVSFFLNNRTRRSIAPSCWGLFGRRHHVVVPYLARPLRSFLMSLPHDYHRQGNLHTLAIHHGYPELQHYEYAGTGPLQPITLPSHLRNIRSSARFNWNKVQTGMNSPGLTLARMLRNCLSPLDLVNSMTLDRKLNLLRLAYGT